MLPEGQILPAAGEALISALEAELAPGIARVLGHVVARVDEAAILRTGRRFRQLAPERQERLLRVWERDSLLRWPLYLISTLFKTYYYDSPEYFAAMNCVFDKRGAVEPARWLANVERGASLPTAHETEVECDVVVVGTGAGGAVVGKELAEQGYAVVFLEEGSLHRRDSFNGRSRHALGTFYRTKEPMLSVGNTVMPIMVGRMVGGSTALNGGTWCRALPQAMERWANEGGLAGLSAENLGPYFQRAETQLGVEPTKSAYLGKVPELMRSGCDKLGWSTSFVARNAPDCDGQGSCLWGCPTDAKRSTNVSYMPWALARGATLYTDVKAEEVLLERGRATGIRARHPATGATLTVRARAVVLSCGAVHTPLLLLGQGLANSSGQVGRNLTLHPATTVSALFKDRLDAHNAVPQPFLCDEFRDDGLLLYVGSPSPDAGAASFSFSGTRLVEVMDAYDHVATMTVIAIDDSKGRVRRRRDGHPFISYWLGREDLARLHRGVASAAEIFDAAGATKVFPLYHNLPIVQGRAGAAELRAFRPSPRDLVMTSVHPLGTCRMGLERKTSVVGPDHETHDVSGLFIVDASSLPSTPGVNPQATIMALATRAADCIASKLV